MFMRMMGMLAQRAEQELARGNSDAALRQYELVQTWAPAAAEGPIQACLADGAWSPAAQPTSPQAAADPEVGHRGWCMPECDCISVVCRSRSRQLIAALTTDWSWQLCLDGGWSSATFCGCGPC